MRLVMWNNRNKSIIFGFLITVTVFIVLLIFLGTDVIGVNFERSEETVKYRNNKQVAASGSLLTVKDLFSSVKAPTRIIHQTWKSSTYPSSRMERWARSWKTCFPDWQYKLWTDKENREFIKLHYPWFLKRYDALPRNIMRVDMVRYFYLFHYGGIYADLDTECLRPFEHLLNASIVLGAMDGHWVETTDIGLIQNSFMYSRPGHPFWLEPIMGLLQRRQEGGVEDTTGPLLLMRSLANYKSRGMTDVMVYPGKYFNPFSWLHNKNPNCKIVGQMSEEDEEKCTASFKEAYVMQFHTKTWAGGRAKFL